MKSSIEKLENILTNESIEEKLQNGEQVVLDYELITDLIVKMSWENMQVIENFKKIYEIDVFNLFNVSEVEKCLNKRMKLSDTNWEYGQFAIAKWLLQNI